MKKIMILILAVFFVFGPATASSDYATVNYKFDFQEETADKVEVLAYDCKTPDCSKDGLSSFSGNFPDGRILNSPEDGEEFTINFPSEDGDYAVYFFAEGYIPQAWHYNYSGTGEIYDPYFDGFDKHNTDSGAVVQNLSAENMVYEDRTLSVDVPAEISGDVESPLDSNVRAVEYLPRNSSDEFYDYSMDVEDFYRADAEINLGINRSGSNIYSKQDFRSIYMDESSNFDFEWVPTREGQYEIEAWTKVVDSMFSTEPVESSSLTLLINDWAYQAILDGLSIDTVSDERHVGNTIEFSVDYRSYFDQDIEVTDGGEIVDRTDPVETDLTYRIIDEEGKVVEETTERLSAVEEKTKHSFTWKPAEPGTYDIETRADPVQNDSSLNASFAEASIQDLTIEEEPVYNVTFDVESGSGSSVSQASVEFNSQTYETGTDGKTKIQGISEGKYDYTVNHVDYEGSSGSVKVDDETTGAESTELIIDVVLQESPTPPDVNLPDKAQVFVNRTNTIELDQYVDDDQVGTEDILWTVEGNSNLDIFIERNRTANIDPQGWTGTEEVTFTAEDTVNNLEGQDTMEIISIENEAPQIESIGDAELLYFESRNEHAYLPSIVSDDTTGYSDLDIRLEKSRSNNCGVKIADDRISIDPKVDYSTTCDIQLVIEDEYGFQSTEKFTVTVLNPKVEIIKKDLVDDNVSAYSTYQGEIIEVDSSIDTQDTNFTVENGPEGLEIKSNGELYWDYPTSEDANQTYNFTVHIEHRLKDEYPDEGDWEDTENYSLTVLDADESMVPEADLQVNQTEGFTPLSVSFDGSNSSIEDGEVASYNWDFGEGTRVKDQEVNESLEKVTFTYNESGTFTARLTVVSDKGLEDTESVTVKAKEMPDEIDQIGINSSGFTPKKPIYGERVNLSATLDQEVNLVQREARVFIAETGENIVNATQMNKQGRNLSTKNISFDDQVAEAFEQGYSQATVVGEISLEDSNSNIARAQEEFTINSPDMEILEPQVQAAEAEFRAQIHSIGDFSQLTPRFEYREVGTETWSRKELEPITSGGRLSEPITLEKNKEYEYRLVLSVNPEFTTDTRKFQTSGDSGGDNDDSGSSGGSSGGGSGGGGGFFGGFFTSDTAEDISSRVQFIDQSLSFDLTGRGVQTKNISLNFTESTRVSLSTEGNISKILRVQNSVKSNEVTQVPVTFNATEPGTYTGNISVNWEGQSLKLPVTARVKEVERFDGEIDMVILADTAGLSSSAPKYSVKMWDRSSPERFEDVNLRTRIEDSSGDRVYENVEDVRLGDVAVRDFRPGTVQPGEYTVRAEAEIDGKTFTGFKTVEVVEPGSITGDFSQGSSIIGFLEGIWNSITALF